MQPSATATSGSPSPQSPVPVLTQFQRAMTDSTLNPSDRSARLARDWRVTVDASFETPSSMISYGRRDDRPVVLKVVKRLGDEWHSGEVLDAFASRGVVRVYEYVDG